MVDFTANHLLASLGSDGDRVRELATRVDLMRGDPISGPGEKIAYVYFPTDALISTVADVKGRKVEIGIAGRDGMTGTALSYGVDSPPWETFVQVAGAAWRIAADDLRALFLSNPAVRALLLRYAYCFSIQVSETAFTNGIFALEPRLARWLLMCHDRLGGDEVAITHEFLAIMLAVRRPAVTLAVQVLEGEGLIRGGRAKIVIRDRKGLVVRAGDTYGTAEREYTRVMGKH